MSHDYKMVGWTAEKRRYDLLIGVAILAFLIGYGGVVALRIPGSAQPSPEILAIRALGSCGFIMLTMILLIGPLARLNVRFLPLLYNRRHLGVCFFLIALAHGGLSIIWYHGFGIANPIVSVLSGEQGEALFFPLPFQAFGLIALTIFFLLAATSHDYWNNNLGAPVWKALHMAVYAGYGLVIVHLAGGLMQKPAAAPIAPLIVGASLALVAGLHLLTALRQFGERRLSLENDEIEIEDWRSIRNDRARIVGVGNDRIAVFRYDAGRKFAAVANACPHQNGPLGEGRVLDGCITCPWHGYQYRPEDGCSPPPFEEKVETYRLRFDGDRLLLDPTALPPGTARPVAIASQHAAS